MPIDVLTTIAWTLFVVATALSFASMHKSLKYNKVIRFIIGVLFVLAGAVWLVLATLQWGTAVVPEPAVFGLLGLLWGFIFFWNMDQKLPDDSIEDPLSDSEDNQIAG